MNKPQNRTSLYTIRERGICHPIIQYVYTPLTVFVILSISFIVFFNMTLLSALLIKLSFLLIRLHKQNNRKKEE